MSRIAAGGMQSLLPTRPCGYVRRNETHVRHLLRRHLRRSRVLHRDRPDAPLSETTDSRSELNGALEHLDPGDRALLELSLQRGIPDDELARVLGNDAGDI